MEIIRIPLHAGDSENKPDKIIVHAMAQYVTYNGEDMFAPYFLAKINLSAHRMMTPEGDMIKCRGDVLGAWHAKAHNENSLGIEFLVQGVHDYDSFIERMKTTYLTDIQLANGIYVITSWMKKWDISIDNVFTHHMIDPNRKADPGVEAARILDGVSASLSA